MTKSNVKKIEDAVQSGNSLKVVGALDKIDKYNLAAVPMGERGAVRTKLLNLAEEAQDNLNVPPVLRRVFTKLTK